MQQNPGWRHGELLTPDSFMRLVRIEDMLAAGRPLHAVMRDGSGHGTLLHWSHLLDSLLLLLAAPFVPWLSWHTALDVAGMISGPLSLAALGAAVAWTAAPVAKHGWLWLGAFAAGSAPAIRNYGLLGQVSHHVLLVVVAVMAAGWALRLLRGEAPAAEGGAAMGAWAGVAAWLSPEAVPFSLMAVLAVWAAWLRVPPTQLRRALVAHGIAFCGVVLLALAVDPPAVGWLSAEPDRLSLPFLALAGGALATALFAHTGHRWPPVLFAAAAAAIWLTAFPQLLHGTSGLMDAASAAAFFSGITEMAPVASLGDAMNFILGGAVACAALAGFTWSGRHENAVWPLLATTVCCSVALLLATQHIRFAAYPEAAGGVLLPVLLTVIGQSRLPPLAASACRVVGIVLLTATPALYSLLPARAGAAQAGTVCDPAVSAKLLAGHAGQIVLAQPDDTPELLYDSRVLTVGSLYHRAPAGFMRLRAAWRAVPGATPGAALVATGASLVLACPGAPRSVLVTGLPETTLLDRLNANDPPRWLTRVADGGGAVLYQVRN